MRIHHSLILLTCCLLVAPVLAGGAGSADAKAMQGKWKVVSLEIQGKPAPPESFADGRVLIKGDEIHLSLNDRKVKFRLDPSKTPKAIDLIPQNGIDKGKVIPGIYALEKGRLKICAPDFSRDAKERPTAFRTRAGDGLGLLILERARQ